MWTGMLLTDCWFGKILDCVNEPVSLHWRNYGNATFPFLVSVGTLRVGCPFLWDMNRSVFSRGQCYMTPVKKLFLRWFFLRLTHGYSFLNLPLALPFYHFAVVLVLFAPEPPRLVAYTVHTFKAYFLIFLDSLMPVHTRFGTLTFRRRKDCA